MNRVLLEWLQTPMYTSVVEGIDEVVAITHIVNYVERFIFSN